jgi:hypothetical protein
MLDIFCVRYLIFLFLCRVHLRQEAVREAEEQLGDPEGGLGQDEVQVEV